MISKLRTLPSLLLQWTHYDKLRDWETIACEWKVSVTCVGLFTETEMHKKPYSVIRGDRRAQNSSQHRLNSVFGLIWDVFFLWLQTRAARLREREGGRKNSISQFDPPSNVLTGSPDLAYGPSKAKSALALLRRMIDASLEPTHKKKERSRKVSFLASDAVFTACDTCTHTQTAINHALGSLHTGRVQ